LSIDGLIISDITGRGIYARGEVLNISGVTASDIRGRALELFSFSKIVLKNSQFDKCGDVFLDLYSYASFNGASLIDVNNLKITNVQSGYDTGLYVFMADREIKLNNVTIENVPDGRGMRIYSSSTEANIVIADCLIRNTKSSGNGGGIHLDNAGNTEIYRTTIENVEVSYGGGIYSSNKSNNIIISNLTIKNATADRYGGLRFISDNMIVEDSLFENCTAVSGVNKIFDFSWSGDNIFRRCTFIHNNNLKNLTYETGNHTLLPAAGWFEDCTFTNLRINNSENNYIFDSSESSLTLKNCIFNFQTGSARLIQKYNLGAPNPYSILMDGVTINNSGGPQPLMVLINYDYFGSTNMFQFKLNNVYNGTPLNSMSAINSLVNSNIIRLQNGALPTIVP